MSNLRINGDWCCSQTADQATLTASQTASGDDRLTLSTKPAGRAVNAKVEFIRMVPGPVDQIVATRRTGQNGSAQVIVNDSRPQQKTRYFAVIFSTKFTSGDRANSAA